MIMPMLDDSILNSYMKAGKAVAEALKLGQALARPGTKLLDLGELLESKIKQNGAELAFPVNLSMNECAAHYSPIIDDQHILPPIGLLKIDCGAHFEGYIADAAITVNLGKESGLNSNLIQAVQDALYHAIKHFKPGTMVREIGQIIQREIEKFPNIRPIINLGGHQLKQWNLHAGIFVPNHGQSSDTYVLKEGDQFAIEPFSTNGVGSIKNGPEMAIFRVENIQKKKNLPMDEKLLLKKFKDTFHSLPFSPRWVDFIPKARIQDTILKYFQNGVFDGYHTFIERGNGMVAQMEHTVIVTNDGGLPTTWWENFNPLEK